MGEVDEAQYAEDQRQPDRAEGVVVPGYNPVDGRLGELCRPFRNRERERNCCEAEAKDEQRSASGGFPQRPERAPAADSCIRC